MKKERMILLILLTFVLVQGRTQEPVKGMITYEYISGANVRLLDMWFTPQNYLYQYRSLTDVKQMPQLKNRTFSSTEDSLKFVESMERMVTAMKNMPVQRWYGQLGSNEVIYSSFDNNLKNYCIRDTQGFVQWELAADTATIRGVACQKATGKFNGISYTAWFATAIPVSVAPLQFRGLPGLMIQLVNHSNNVTIGMVDLQWPYKRDVAIKPCSDAPFISKQELEAIRNAQNANIIKMAQDTQRELKKKSGSK